MPKNSNLLGGPYLRFSQIKDNNTWFGSVMVVVAGDGHQDSSSPSVSSSSLVQLKLNYDNLNDPIVLSSPTCIDKYSTDVITKTENGTLVASRSGGSSSGADGGGCVYFLRFDVTIPMLPDRPTTVNYQVLLSNGSATDLYSFHVPPAWPLPGSSSPSHPFRWAFNSCNGFSLSVSQQEKDRMGGLRPLWDDMMARNSKAQPIYLLVGGGDQVYADAVWQLPCLKEWLAIKGRDNRHKAEFTSVMQREISDFYFYLYLNCFNEPGVCNALASIPQLNMLDDHDLWDGCGSYPEYLESSLVFKGLKSIAYRFYLLFQHQSHPNEKQGFIGTKNGGYSLLKCVTPSQAVLMVDCRAERTRERVVLQDTWDEIFVQLEQQLPSTVKHLSFVTGVPLVYPRLENIEEMMHWIGRTKHSFNKGYNRMILGVGKAIKAVFGEGVYERFQNHVQATKNAFGKTGMMKKVLNMFGEPELADDLIDHWTSAQHDGERNWLIKRLQQFAGQKKVRVTFIGGDVHVGAVGRLYDPTKLESTDAIKDPNLMFQIVSSAIGNVVPPARVCQTVNKSGRGKPIVLDESTSEKMLRIFENDVNGLKNPIGSKIMGRRNYCIVEEKPAPEQSLTYSLMVENVDYKQPSVAYDVVIPPLVLDK